MARRWRHRAIQAPLKQQHGDTHQAKNEELVDGDPKEEEKVAATPTQ
jgi:hypothetical protein